MLAHLLYGVAPRPVARVSDDAIDDLYAQFCRIDQDLAVALDDVERLQTKAEVTTSLRSRLSSLSRESASVLTAYSFDRLTPRQHDQILHAAQEGLVEIGRKFIEYLMELATKAWTFLRDKITGLFQKTSAAAPEVASVAGNPSIAAGVEADAPATDSTVEAEVPPLEVIKEAIAGAKSEIIVGTTFGGLINLVMAEKGKRGATKEMIDEYVKNATAASKDLQRRVLKGTSAALPERATAPASALQGLKKKVNLRSAGYTRQSVGGIFQQIRSLLNPANLSKSIQSLKTGIMGLGRLIARKGVGSLGIIRYTGMMMWRLFKQIWWHGAINKVFLAFTAIMVVVKAYKKVKNKNQNPAPEGDTEPAAA